MDFSKVRDFEYSYYSLADVVPWSALIAPGIVINKDESLMQVFSYAGLDQDSATREELMTMAAKANNYVKRFGEGWCLWFEARRVKANVYKHREFPDVACQLLDNERQNYFNHDSYYVNKYYLILQWLPPSTRAKYVSKIFYADEGAPDKEQRKQFAENLQTFRNSVAKFVDGFMSIMYELRPLTSEETLTYMHSCVSLDDHEVGLPLEPVYLSEMLCDTAFYGGTSPVLGSDRRYEHIGCVSIRSYPEESFPCILDELNRLDIEYRWMSRFICRDKADAQSYLNTIKRMWKANDKDLVTWLKELVTKEESVMVDTASMQRFYDADEALVEVSNDFVSVGDFTSQIILRDEDIGVLNDKMRKVSLVYNDRGFVVSPESINATSAWFGTIPGNAYSDPRRKTISSLNFCHILPLSSVWAGNEYCEHLSNTTGKRTPAIAQVATVGSTPFFLNLHVNDVGHSIVVGPTGSGKSVLLNFLASQCRSVMNARIYVFDKGASSRVFAAAIGGKFYDLGNQDVSDVFSFQPLRYIDDENEKIWASEWLQELFEQEGITITPDLKKVIWDALTSLAATEPRDRTITGLKVYLQSMVLREALEPYVIKTEGISDTAGAYGSLFDSDMDFLKLGSYQSFEMGELMNKKNAVLPLLLYLFHVIEKNCSGEPTFIFLDECWTFLDNPVFASKIREWLKTMRKNNVSIIFATQNLDDIKRCSISSAIIESCLTRFFLPNSQALNQGNEEVYGYFNLNRREREIIAFSRPKRDYYVVSPEGRRQFDLALSPYALAILASTSKDDQLKCKEILDVHGKKNFLSEWLEYKKLPKAKEALLEEMENRKPPASADGS